MAAHIKKVVVDSYRGIKNLELDGLGKVNIFLGDNNVGKTSLLEVIQLLCNPCEYNLINVARQRENKTIFVRTGLRNLDALKYMFDIYSDCRSNNYYFMRIAGDINDKCGQIDVVGNVVSQLVDMTDERYRGLRDKIELSEHGEVEMFIGEIKETFNNTNIHVEIDNFKRITRIVDKELLKCSFVKTIDYMVQNPINAIVRNKNIKSIAVELLKNFDEDITDIRYISDNGERYIPVVDICDKEYMPLSMYGDGMRKVLTMINAMAYTENGVVLIDEFENGIHTSVMNIAFKFMLKLAEKLNIQLFLTTHSIEAVDKILEISKENSDDLRVIRLRKKNRKIFPKIMTGEEALNDRQEYGMELRV